MSVTLTQLATDAAQEIHVLDSAEGLSSAQIADALRAVNRLLDNWSSEQVMIPKATRLTVALAAGTQAYVLNPTPPLAIASAAMNNASGPGTPVQVCNEHSWTAILDRQSTSYLVRKLFYDRINTVYVSPVPQGAGLTLELWAWVPLAVFADATTPLALPAGYERPLMHALAMEIAPQYDVQPSASLIAAAGDALARIRHLNAQLFGGEPPAGDVSAAGGAPIQANQGAQ